MKNAEKKTPGVLVKILLVVTLLFGGSIAAGADYVKEPVSIGFHESINGAGKEVMVGNPVTGQSIPLGISCESFSAGDVKKEVHGTKIEFELKNVSIGGLDIR